MHTKHAHLNGLVLDWPNGFDMRGFPNSDVCKKLAVYSKKLQVALQVLRLHLIIHAVTSHCFVCLFVCFFNSLHMVVKINQHRVPLLTICLLPYISPR